MAKSRMLARSISIDKELNSLSLKSQLIYTWCVPFLDDFGLLTNDCGNIKYLIFPRNTHITEDDIVSFLKEALKVGLIEEADDCIYFKGFEKHNPLTDYKKSKSEFTENRWNKGKSKYSPEIPGNPPENPSKDKIREVKRRYKYNTSQLDLAKLLLSKIRENIPGFKEPKIEDWAEEVEKMMRIDKRTYEQVKYLIEWAQRDSFWRSNILSTKKLRSKFDQLVGQAKRDHEKNSITIIG